MDARSIRKTNDPLWLGVTLVALFASILTAEAKCTIRSGDPLIKARYQGCNPRSFISYLYNDLITPYSFTCAKQLKATCQNEKCEHPATEAEAKRCLDRFTEVLTSCSKQIDDAARMAKCTDTKAWPVDRILAQFVAAMPRAKVATTAAPATVTTTAFAPMVIPAEKHPAQTGVSANSLPRSNGPMTDAEKAEMAAAASADAEATATREAPPAPTVSILDTTSPPAPPTAVGEITERAPAAAPDPSSAPATAPSAPSVKAEPLPGETFEVARKPAHTSSVPRSRYPTRN